MSSERPEFAIRNRRRDEAKPSRAGFFKKMNILHGNQELNRLILFYMRFCHGGNYNFKGEVENKLHKSFWLGECKRSFKLLNRGIAT